MCARFCSVCRLHLFVASLDRIQLGSRSLAIFDPSSDQPFWLNIPLTYNRLIANLHLNYCSMPSTSLSSEQCNSRTVKRKPNDFKLVIRQLSTHLYMSIFIDRNALWYEKKLSFIYTTNCLNRRTDLDRSLISYRNLLRCSIKIWELYKRCDISRNNWKLWSSVLWWAPLHFIHYLYSLQIKVITTCYLCVLMHWKWAIELSET